jgi:hypothetical protein
MGFTYSVLSLFNLLYTKLLQGDFVAQNINAYYLPKCFQQRLAEQKIHTDFSLVIFSLAF